MRVQVRFFASLADRAERRTDWVDLNDGADVHELWRGWMTRG